MDTNNARTVVSPAEIHRIVSEYSGAWEGRIERGIELRDATVRAEPTFGQVVRVELAGCEVDERIDALVAQVGAQAGRCLWFIGPNTRPVDLDERLIQRGFTVWHEFDGLALDDLDAAIPHNPAVTIEPLSAENAADYAARCTDATDPEWHRYLLESARRYLALPEPEVQIFVARLNGELAGYAVFRIDPAGIAYLANSLTVQGFRRRGVYASMTVHRLRLARGAGCRAVTVVAQADTSAPILKRWGFQPVCRLRILVPPRTSSAT